MGFLEEDEMAFDNLYCIAFRMMDAQWLAKRASYMEFNVKMSLNQALLQFWNFLVWFVLTGFFNFEQDVLKSTRAQLERELALDDVSSIRDLPAFTLLYK